MTSIKKSNKILCVLMSAILAIALALPMFGSANAADSNDVSSEGTVLQQDANANLTINRVQLPGNDDSKETWTFMLYCCGSDLESNGSFAVQNLQEVLDAYKSITNTNIKFIVQTGGATKWHSVGGITPSTSTMQRYEISKDGISLKENNISGKMNEASSLQSFVEWGCSNYSSEKMCLIMWDHGNGSVNGLCNDQTNNSAALSVSDLNTALLGATKSGKLTKKMEFIGFDTCLMGNICTANAIAPYCEYMNASEELEPGCGWNYTTLLNEAASAPTESAATLCKNNCDYFYNKSVRAGDSAQTTLSCLDMSKLDNAMVALNKAFKNIRDTKTVQQVSRVVYQCENYGTNNGSEYTNMVDLGNMLVGFSDVAGVSDAQTALSNLVVYCKNGPNHSNSNGLSVYYPLGIQDANEWSTFANVCAVPQYFNFADRMRVGLAGGNVTEYAEAVGATSNAKSAAVSRAYQEKDTNYKNNDGQFVELTEGTLTVDDIYFDSEGYFTLHFKDLSQVSLATGSLYTDESNGTSMYLGAVDNVEYDANAGTLKDRFDGKWLHIDDVLLPVELVNESTAVNTYSCPVQVKQNGTTKDTMLFISYTKSSDSFEITGTWDGIERDNDSVVTSRSGITKLSNGAVITPYYSYDDGTKNYDKLGSKSFTYSTTSNSVIAYEKLPEGPYYYSINVSDAYGNQYYTEEVNMYVDANGNVSVDTNHKFKFGRTAKGNSDDSGNTIAATDTLETAQTSDSLPIQATAAFTGCCVVVVAVSRRKKLAA